MRNGILLGTRIALVVACAADRAWAQIVTENAGTVSPETPIWQTRFEYSKAENVTDSRIVETYFWAPNPTMDFALAIPVIHRDVDLGNGGDGRLEGIGDATLRWKNSIWKLDDVMKSTRFSTLAGVKFPTGAWHDEVDGIDVPRKLQLGTGAFGFYGGPLFTQIDDRHRFAVEAIGAYDLEHDGFRLQPSLRLGLAYWYRIFPERIEIAGRDTEVRGVFELTSSFYGESDWRGQDQDDDGNITWLSPGIQIYPSTRWLLEASLQLPVIETLEDAQGDRKYGFLLSVKFLF